MHIDQLPTREGFVTSKGSVYEITSDGSTIRDKAARPEHPGDSGRKEKSARTVYVYPDLAREIGMWQTSSATQKRILLHGDQVILTSLNQQLQKRGWDRTVTDATFVDRPELGLSPLELTHPSQSPFGLWYAGNHPGNPIVRLNIP